MQYKKTLGSALLLAGGLMLGAASASAAPDGAMLANTCAGCHGLDGASVGPASPIIGGVAEDTFIEAMEAYRNGDRPSTIMGRIVAKGGYTDEEIKAMAKFFAGKKWVSAKQNTDAAAAASGKKLHKKFCEKCHEDGGAKDVDGSNILAGQWMPYLTYSMEDFHNGVRDMSKKMKKRMKKMYKQASDKGFGEIVQFYGSRK
ncbi:MAG: c-type cytochrome [Gammaproteobacteria bacterium]|nr:c-type cytochrome [Gammaproteobacteria bacterium]